MAQEAEREVVWTNAARTDLQAIYDFNIQSRGEADAYKLIEDIYRKADELYQPIIGSTRFVSERYPERNYQKLVIHPYMLIFRQIGQVVFINRIFDSRRDPSRLDL